jgi:putative lipoic acid-binding regulatory protein
LPRPIEAAVARIIGVVTMADGQRPEIEFPCRWNYRIIGTSEDAIRALIAELVGEAEHEVAYGQASSGGTYVSLLLTVQVEDDAHRLAVYAGLTGATCVRVVL